MAERLVDSVNHHSGQNLLLCYQCQKCTATCPVSDIMDIKPDVMVRKVIQGDEAAIVRSRTIWVCAGCESCGSRCPNLISVGAVNEFFRERSVRAGVTPAVTKAFAVHKAFLSSIARFGVVHEASMLAEFKLRSRDLFSDLALGMKMFLKGKVHIGWRRIAGMDEIRRIMKGNP